MDMAEDDQATGNADEATSDAATTDTTTTETTAASTTAAADEGNGPASRAVLADLADERKKRQALEAELKERKDAELSAQEKAEQRATEAEEKTKVAEAKARDTEIKTAVKLAAVDAKFVKPGHALALISTDGLDPEADTFDEDVKKLVEELAKDSPNLVGAGGGTTAIGNGATRGGDVITAADIRKDPKLLEKMSDEEIDAALQR